jgi:hypothetical protein
VLGRTPEDEASGADVNGAAAGGFKSLRHKTMMIHELMRGRGGGARHGRWI